jgi:hypothetical protein
MKRLFSLLLCLLFLFACDVNNTVDNVPVLENLRIVDDQTGLEYDSYMVMQKLYFAFTILDTDLDITEAVLIQKNGSAIIGPTTINLPVQINGRQAYDGNITPELEGTWLIALYVKDNNGNTSNTINKTIIVNEGLRIFYNSNGHELDREVIDTKRYIEGEEFWPKIASIKIGANGLLPCRWNTKSDGSGIYYYPGGDSYGHGGVMPNHNLTLYALSPN